MIKEILEAALSEELSQHLDQEKKGSEQEFSNDFDNRRNSYNSKTLKTRESAFTLDAPRDRNGFF